MLNMTFITALLTASIRMTVPILYPAIGEAVAERSGVMNIGLEGQMLIGAFVTLITYNSTENIAIGIILGGLAGAISSCIVAFVGVSRNQPQAVVGFMFNLFAAGVTSYLYRVLYGASGVSPTVEMINPIKIPLLSSVPIIGPILFEQDILTYLAFILAFAVGFVMYKTKFGLQIRSLGENPRAAQSCGINVIRIRWGTIAFSGFMAGLGGAFLTVGIVGRFMENISAGRGFLALAVCILCHWNPVYSIIGAFGFGFVNAFQLRLQALGVGIPYQLLLMLPYVAALLGLALLGRNMKGPKTVGAVYEKEGR